MAFQVEVVDAAAAPGSAQELAERGGISSAEVVIAVFDGSHKGLDHAFTCAILCRNEVNHLGCSTATYNASTASISSGETAVLENKTSEDGAVVGYQLVARPK